MSPLEYLSKYQGKRLHVYVSSLTALASHPHILIVIECFRKPGSSKQEQTAKEKDVHLTQAVPTLDSVAAVYYKRRDECKQALEAAREARETLGNVPVCIGHYSLRPFVRTGGLLDFRRYHMIYHHLRRKYLLISLFLSLH